MSTRLARPELVGTETSIGPAIGFRRSQSAAALA
jgi:hypothetical protein